VTTEEILALAEKFPDRDERPVWLATMRQDVNHPGAPYYRFLYELAKAIRPELAVEIGTFLGASAAHLALGHPGGFVVTVDSNPDAKRHAEDLKIKNLYAVTDDSMRFVENGGVAAYQTAVEREGIDLLYIDGNHTFNSCYGEYVAYRKFMKDGGIILVDDCHVHPEMDVAWRYIVDPKIRLDWLHNTGFGVVVVDKKIVVPLWMDVIGQASKEFGA
jgi:predicted O-methyltransferase YrrM